SYPQELYRVVVIADNCVDETAGLAAARGAQVLVRQDSENVGKGYALEWAAARLTGSLYPDYPFDGLVVLDADTVISPNLLRCFEKALLAGNAVAQVRYEVLNRNESWRTRLMVCALAVAHVVKPLGRERLQLSDGLKGNGMCFAADVLREVRWSGDSITEDIDYTLNLCRRGYRIAFVPEAAVWAQMPVTGAQAVSQRHRWEAGRYRLLRHKAAPLLVEAIRGRRRILFDRAIDLLIPPFAELFAAPACCLVVCALLVPLPGWHWPLRMAWWWASILTVQLFYLAAGLWIARVPLSISSALVCAPVYVLWKAALYCRMAVSAPAGWRRTERREFGN
ncbi:MAG TPA: glycosyltransferase, partial [Chthonomonadales bacterium]|nr:glycosyltransferase [Chthonomonadales bacterium]